MNSPLTFKDGASAFEYTTKYFSGARLEKNEAIYGLVMEVDRASPGDAHDLFILKIGIQKKTLFSSKTEILTVDGFIHPDANFDLEVGDLVLWGCVDKDAEPYPYGVIVQKCELFLDADNKQFVTVT
jgi:hypothetical protein